VITFITFVECMIIVHTVFSCVSWIHIHFSLRQHTFIIIILMNYLGVKNLYLYLIRSPRKQQQIFQYSSGLLVI